VAQRKPKKKKRQISPLVDWLASAPSIAVIRMLQVLPYRWRVPFGGWLLSRVVGPLIGYPARIRENLGLVFPDMSEEEKARLSRAVPEKIGRTVTEMFSPEDLKAVAAQTPITGPGLEAAAEARSAGRPVIFVSGHIGNYDVGRAILIQQGHHVGGLYRRMNYRRFNDFYVKHISAIGTPLFLRGRRGMAEMVRHLKQGNAVAILIDQYMGSGADLTFFGHPARTALSAAELALKYDALVVPCYALRQDDGMHFKMVLEEPVAHGTPEEMTQALNDSLERQVRAHMDQWLWVHRRWKQRSGRKARTG
jgi:KDO2-lipid IV(A) lauroyltransferase